MDEGVARIYKMMLLFEPGTWKVESTGYKIDGDSRRFYIRFYSKELDQRELVLFNTKLPLPIRLSKEAQATRNKVFKTGR